MKKNILKATLVAAFALIAGFNVYNSQKSDVMSELALANVEALADDGETLTPTECPGGRHLCHGQRGPLHPAGRNPARAGAAGAAAQG